MPHGSGTGYPWVDEDGKGAWRLVVLQAWWSRRGTLCRSEGEEERGVSIKVLDGEGHDVEAGIVGLSIQVWLSLSELGCSRHSDTLLSHCTLVKEAMNNEALRT